MSEYLYGKNDLIGFILSLWRNYFVSSHVHGFLVDVACGDNRLVHLHGNGCGVDINNRGYSDVIEVKDFSHLPFENCSADTISIVASLNYFEDPYEVLVESKRILRPNGTLLVTMSNETVMKLWHRFRDPHVLKPSIGKSDMLELASESGFELSNEKPFMFGINRLYIMTPKDIDPLTCGGR